MWCGTQKKPPCVDSKRPRVYRHHARMCQNMRAWCRYTRGRFESTHGGFLDGHTEGRGSSSVLPKFAHVWSSRASEVHHKKPKDLTHFQFENRSREQHVADSSKHSLCLMKLLRDTAEGISTPSLPTLPLPHAHALALSNAHVHVHVHVHIHVHVHVYVYVYVYMYMCMCICICVCVYVYVYVYVYMYVYMYMYVYVCVCV